MELLSLRFSGRPRGASRSRSGEPASRLRTLTLHLQDRQLLLRALVGVLVGVLLLLGGWLWLRDSSLVSVEHVRISGVHGLDALEIPRSLDAAAKRMTTMDFDVAALRAAVAPFVVVSGVSATTS